MLLQLRVVPYSKFHGEATAKISSLSGFTLHYELTFPWQSLMAPPDVGTPRHHHNVGALDILSAATASSNYLLLLSCCQAP